MNQLSPALQMLMSMTKAQTKVARTFDARLGQGIGFNDFIILYTLEQAEGQKMRRIDLADAVGLTASGVTKMLIPMEKIGLVGRESNPRDARVSYVTLASGGRRILLDTIEKAEYISESLLSTASAAQLATLSRIFDEMKWSQ